jgi:hypothetical protein
MLDLFLCNVNISCHFDNIKQQLSITKYPAEYAEVCQFFAKEKIQLPEYCKIESKPMRKRNEF